MSQGVLCESTRIREGILHLDRNIWDDEPENLRFLHCTETSLLEKNSIFVSIVPVKFSLEVDVSQVQIYLHSLPLV